MINPANNISQENGDNLKELLSPLDNISLYESDMNYTDMIERISDYINVPTRHHIVFTYQDLQELEFVNLGFELAKKLQDQIKSQSLASFAIDILNKTDDNVRYNSAIGKYVAIKNIAILMEPELHISFIDYIEQWSKNLCIVVKLEDYIDLNQKQITDSITIK